MEMRTGSLFFQPVRGSGPLTATQTINFPREVQRAVAGMVGYSAGFSGDDHHFGLLDLRLDTQIDSDIVVVTGTFGLRDWSGDWDDNYTGTIQFTVLADLAPITLPPPRQDLDITGMELTQAIQSFRSAQHLDLPNVRPDNSIRLIARKSTGVRVYVDYDSSAGLPLISSLSGELEVTTSVGSTTFTLAPRRAIAPRRDNQIDRGQVDHTLNFVIPEGWCQGELTLRCRVFDAASPSQRSEMFQRTIRFDDVAPLRLYGVGVHYTGQGLDLAAPTQAAVMSTMSFVESTYPIGEVLLTGYSTIDYDKDMKADIDDGCGDGFNDLLDQLRDMRGDSGDVYYAVLPPGIDSGSVGGCGGGGVGAGFGGGGATAAQEIGHAFGRDHAPCDDESRCSNPDNQDGSYPHYDSFPSDSIGEYGYDPLTNTVFAPSSTFDFMGYSGPNWVSPYTYTGLMTRFPVQDGRSGSSRTLILHEAMLESSTGAIQREERPEWIRTQTEKLFLGLTIDRDRRVTPRASFHYPAYPQRSPGCPTEFSVEFRDAEGNVLGCHALHEECSHSGVGCWPKRFRDAVPFPAGARTLLIWEGKEKLHEAAIPHPPAIKLSCKYLSKERVFELRWSASDTERAASELWYLVQWQDNDGTWRGLAPRTQATMMHVPVKILGDRREMDVRVLVTSGIATGSASCSLAVKEREHDDVDVVLVGVPRATTAIGVSPLLRVAVLARSGRSVVNPEVRWYDQAGVELSRGRVLDLHVLGEGQHIVRAVVLGAGRGANERAWLVERIADDTFVLHPSAPSRSRKRSNHHHDHDHDASDPCD